MIYSLGAPLTTSVLQVPAFWVFLVLIVVSIACFTYISIRQYKYKQACKRVQDYLKVGDYIKTFSGLLGEVVKIDETNSIKIVTIRNLNGKNGEFTIDASAICKVIDLVE